ncbi:MAG: TolC family outer membrane protein [Paracoccaceae bacterium]|nr:TolC family outer membrane protein [Loktanella sp.]
MTVRATITGLFTATSLLMASVAHGETLADALTAAYTNSGLLEQNRALLRAADEDVAQAVGSTLPVIAWSAGATSSTPRRGETTTQTAGGTIVTPADDLIQFNASITGELVLYDGGASAFAIEAQKEIVLATRQSLIGVEQQVLLDAVSAYMDVRRESEFLTLRQNNVRLISEELRATRDRFEVGEVTRTDVSLAEARLASARSLLAAAEGNLDQARYAYEVAVGRSPGALSDVSPAPVSRSEAEARAFALRNHPAILETRHNVSAAELNIRRGEAGYNPTITLNGQVSARTNNGVTNSNSVGVNVRGPIYNGGRLSSQVRQLMARRDAARAGLHITSQQIEQSVGNAYSFLEVTRASSRSLDEQVRAATVAFDGIREEATLGARSSLDVLTAEQELLDARANTISAQADEVIASYQLLSTMGLLTAEHLRLPVQRYDPAAYYNLVKDAPTIVSEQGQALDRVLSAIGRD